MKKMTSMYVTILFFFSAACSHSGLSTYNDMMAESDEEFTYQPLLAETEGHYSTYAVVKTEQEVRDMKEAFQNPLVETSITSQENDVEDIKYGGLNVSHLPSYYVFDTETLLFETHDKEEFLSYLEELE
ncbi:hypothetical protein [Alkalicoccus urumqiensis]|uniref:Lipoprotein n=1 Tax=Alkalicoccus urumqiensis TaxID=1548213 RepID=A0A2P6MLA8_ALKUR|nr:hypothetical protein [Alkalicoccus urumqiensis]PRO67068.1 hypothetical protein C6I21_00430 [Alkalicoccus urumqiensis]